MAIYSASTMVVLPRGGPVRRERAAPPTGPLDRSRGVLVLKPPFNPDIEHVDA